MTDTSEDIADDLAVLKNLTIVRNIVNGRLSEKMGAASDEIRRLRSINADLYEALRDLIEFEPSVASHKRARAALAKAQGTQEK